MRLATLQIVAKLAMLVGCSGVPTGPEQVVPKSAETILIRGGLIDGERRDLAIVGGRLADAASIDSAAATVIDADGLHLLPGVIDSHVHLALYRVGDDLRRSGVAGAVDLAAPLDFLQQPPPLRLRAAGPMLTAAGGYPTQSWGQGGYGIECGSAECARAAVDTIAASGATVLKLPMTDAGGMSRAELAAAIERAAVHDMVVAAHALSRDDARLAAELSVDVLAHVPLEPLSASDAALWSGRAFITTHAAFGATGTVVGNMRALHAAGAVALYGTDLGNERRVGISADELAALSRAGLTPSEVVRAATEAPAELWGFADLGSLAPGHYGCVLLTSRDPRVDPTALAHVERVAGCERPRFRSDAISRFGQLFDDGGATR